MPDKDAVVGVIPARYGSTRFPGKPLAKIAGKPMIQHVYERTSGASLLSKVIVATDDDRIVKAVEGFGGEVMMTSSDHPTGTDRVAEVAGRLDAPYYVNVQGDEPLIDPDHLDLLAQMLLDGEEMSTLATRIRWRHELFDQNVAKLTVDEKGHAMYFSRSVIPFPRKYLDKGIDVDLESSTYLKHVGVYGYTAAALRTLASKGLCELEQLESLEQLRALAAGIPIKVGLVDSESPHVEVPEDVEKVERAISERG